MENLSILELALSGVKGLSRSTHTKTRIIKYNDRGFQDLVSKETVGSISGKVKPSVEPIFVNSVSLRRQSLNVYENLGETKFSNC